ncbi:MAG: tyrosine-type recombinase/integrase [Candidatus Methylomirabilales bacterium]
MGVKIQKPGEPGHPGGNRRTYVRVNFKGHRKTRVFNSKRAAEEYADQVEALLKLGKVDDVFMEPTPAPDVPASTFQEAAEHWWAVDGTTLKGGTQDTYRNILDKHLLPPLGPRVLSDISVGDVEAWWASLRGTGLSHKRLRTIRGVLAGIFKRAVVGGLLGRNLADAIAGRMGKEDREVRQVEWLTEPELTKVLTVAKEREPSYYPFFLTIVSTGMRLGETLGLQVGDVDLDRGKLAVRRSIRKHRIGSPKSGKPRTVDVPPATVAVLQDWIDTIRAEAAVRGQEATWLFPGKTGAPREDKCFVPALRRILKPAGILRPLRVHDLRHTYASLALQRGVPLLVVSRQLGHSTIAITADTYGHLAPDATREAATAWEAILTEHSRNPRATPVTDPA